MPVSRLKLSESDILHLRSEIKAVYPEGYRGFYISVVNCDRHPGNKVPEMIREFVATSRPLGELYDAVRLAVEFGPEDDFFVTKDFEAYIEHLIETCEIGNCCYHDVSIDDKLAYFVHWPDYPRRVTRKPRNKKRRKKGSWGL